MAKEPVPGRVKTRLTPPCTPDEAADLAAAAIADTLEAALGSSADDVVVVLDGRPGPWCPAGVRIVPQVEGPFDHRLAAAWDAVGGPAVQIGMDTPQVTSQLLDDAMAALSTPGTDAVLGPANDGGWWAIGLHGAVAAGFSSPPSAGFSAVFAGVPMSRPDTGRLQRRRLTELGLSVVDLPELTDVDTFADAVNVAGIAPDTRFAVELALAMAGAES